jgi:hypothetical protein
MGNLNAESFDTNKKQKSQEIEEENEVLSYLFPKVMEEPKYSKILEKNLL